MNTCKCDASLAFPKGMTLLGMTLAFFFGGLSEGWATVTPYYVDASGIQKFALVTDLSHGGNFNVNSSQVNGNTAVLGASGASGANNDTFKGNFSYTGATFDLYNTVTVTGAKSQDFTLASAVQKAADFSKTIAGFTATVAFDQNGNAVVGNGSANNLIGNGGINVVDYYGGNINGTVTLSGGANDVFYINVGANMAMSGVVLSGGVTANHVFWNIINGQNANLSGTLNGTFLAFNASGQATSINVNQATVNGDIYVAGLDANNVTVNGLPAGGAVATAMAPEASSLVIISALACCVIGSSLQRFLTSKQRAAAFRLQKDKSPQTREGDSESPFKELV